MNKDFIKGYWKELKGKVKQQWAKITDDDLAYINGSYEELEGLLQKRYGYNKDQIEKEIDQFVKRYHRTKEHEF